MTRFSIELGTLDEKNIGRDRVPDNATGSLAKGVIAYFFARLAIIFTLSCTSAAVPWLQC